MGRANIFLLFDDDNPDVVAIARKIDRLRRHMRAGDYRSALALAATFQDLGEYDVAIRRAHEAWWHPLFFTQLGLDPEGLITDGIRVLHRRFRDLNEGS